MASSSSSSSPEIHHAPTYNAIHEGFSFQCATEEEVLEELSSRFILNLPDEELASVERICFQVEQAHWFYEDFIRETNLKLPSLPLKKFSARLFAACPLLRQWSSDHEQAFNTFMQYKTRVPVCGAIMLNDKWDKCVLVKGWKSSSGWGFPKGKINQDEEPHKCAIREVLEETGFDLSSRLKRSDHIEMTIKEQRITLYIVGGIPEDYPFQTRTRKEISKIEWFSLSELPTWRRNKQSSGKFYLISPFVPPLKEFVRINKPKRNRQGRCRDAASTSADLSIQTDFEKEEEALNGEREAFTVVRLDRGAHGSSSSSADNNDPSTPSPLSVQAMPVVAEAMGEADAGPGAMDPHFARLLAGLSSSASKLAIKEDSEPVIKSMPAASAGTFVNKGRPHMDKMTVQAPPVSESVALGSANNAEPVTPASARAKPASPRISSITPQQPDQPLAPSAQGSPAPAPIDRHLKHLALLESVANESSSLSSSRISGVNNVSGPPHFRDIPPLPVHAPLNLSHPTRFDTRSIPPHASGNVGPPPPPMHVVHLPPMARQPPVNDPFSVRPMTSHAALPPTLSPRRHGPNMSMHQGHLLNILGGPSGPAAPGRFAPQFQPHAMNAMFAGQGPAYHSQPNGIPPQALAHAPVTQPLRVVPPPPGMFSSNPGPLTAPTGGLNQSHLINTTQGAHMSGMPPTGSERAQHLLSLLNPTSTAQTTPILTADATRPNYPTGSPAVKVPLHTSYTAVSNNTSHR